MYTIERHVGRLIEIRQMSPVPILIDEALAFRDTLLRVVGETTGLVVIVADIRHAVLFSPDAAEVLSSMMKSVNDRLERSAIVLPSERPTLVLQIERLVRAARKQGRRTFRTASAAAAWLSEVLTPAETARLTAFLAD